MIFLFVGVFVGMGIGIVVFGAFIAAYEANRVRWWQYSVETATWRAEFEAKYLGIKPINREFGLDGKAGT